MRADTQLVPAPRAAGGWILVNARGHFAWEILLVSGADAPAGDLRAREARVRRSPLIASTSSSLSVEVMVSGYAAQLFPRPLGVLPPRHGRQHHERAKRDRQEPERKGLRRPLSLPRRSCPRARHTLPVLGQAEYRASLAHMRQR